MKTRVFGAIFLTLALAVSCFTRQPAPFRANADIPVVSLNGTASSTGVVGVMGLSGQGQCAVQITVASGTPVFSITARASNDFAVTWNTATTIGTAGVITAVGTNYNGSIASYGLTAFSLNITSLSGGTINWYETCAPVGGGGSGSSSVTILGTVPVSPPTCAAAPNAPCVQITGQPTVTVGNALATASPGGQGEVQPAYYGANALYLPPMYDSTAGPTITNISLATTTLIYSGSTTLNSYIFLITLGGTGTDTGTNQWVMGQGATCGTSQVPLSQAVAGPASGNLSTMLGNSQASSVNGWPAMPLTMPWVIPASGTAWNYCLITTGTVSLTVRVYAIQRAN